MVASDVSSPSTFDTMEPSPNRFAVAAGYIAAILFSVLVWAALALAAGVIG